MIPIGVFLRYLIWWGLMLVGSWCLYRMATRLGFEWMHGRSDQPVESLLGLMAAFIVFSDRHRRSRIRLVGEMIDRFARGTARRYLRRRFQRYLSSPPGIGQQARRLRDRVGPDRRRYFFQMVLSLALVRGTLTDRERRYLRELGEALGLSPGELDRWIRSARHRRGASRRTAAGNGRGDGPAARVDPERRRATEVLGVDPDASQETIRRAYQEKVRQHHPDQYRAEEDEAHRRAEERMARINRAYQILKESESVG